MLLIIFMIALFVLMAVVICGTFREENDSCEKTKISGHLSKMQTWNAEHWLLVGGNGLNEEYAKICERAYSIFSGLYDIYNYTKDRKLLYNISDDMDAFAELKQQLSIGLEPKMANVIYNKMLNLLQSVEKSYLYELDKVQKTEDKCSLKESTISEIKAKEDNQLANIEENKKRLYEIELLLDKLDFFCLNLDDASFKEKMKEICEYTKAIYDTKNESHRLYGRFAQYYLPEIVKLCQTYNMMKLDKDVKEEQIEEVKEAVLYMKEPFSNILTAVKEDGNIDIKLNIETLKQVAKMDGISSDFS